MISVAALYKNGNTLPGWRVKRLSENSMGKEYPVPGLTDCRQNCKVDDWKRLNEYVIKYIGQWQKLQSAYWNLSRQVYRMAFDFMRSCSRICCPALMNIDWWEWKIVIEMHDLQGEMREYGKLGEVCPHRPGEKNRFCGKREKYARV